MKMRTKHALAATILLTWLLGGCASMQPLSNYARSGDTVAISLGGTDSNALVPILKKQNLTVTLVDAAGASHNVKVRNLFRVYSDPTSKYDYRAPGDSSMFETFVTPHQGQWMAVLDLVDPATEQALPLAAGPATLSVSSPEINQWVDYPGWGWSWTNGNLSSIPIEILPGTGSKNPLNYMQPLTMYPLDSLEPQPQIEVVPVGTPGQMIGGGSFVFRYVVANFGSYGRPRVFTSTPDGNVQLASHIADQGDGTALLKVMISNPHGFNVDNVKSSLAAGRSLLRSLRFSVAWDEQNTNVTDANWQDSLSLVSGRYFDLTGNTMSELSPSVSKIR